MSRKAIRDERSDDAQAILDLTGRAFANAEYSDGSEPGIIARLRKGGALAVSLVWELGSEIRGHIAFSPVAIADGSEGWFGLGPVSVEPSLQGRGIGSALVRAGLERLRHLDAGGCVVLGDPAFYERFGFEHDPKLEFPGPPPRYFQRLVFNGPPPQGEVSYHPAFTG